MFVGCAELPNISTDHKNAYAEGACEKLVRLKTILFCQKMRENIEKICGSYSKEENSWCNQYTKEKLIS